MINRLFLMFFFSISMEIKENNIKVTIYSVMIMIPTNSKNCKKRKGKRLLRIFSMFLRQLLSNQTHAYELEQCYISRNSTRGLFHLFHLRRISQ